MATSRGGAGRPARARARRRGPDGKVKFEVTDKSLDFLGFKTLQDPARSLGKSSFRPPRYSHLATGVESSGSSKLYEFGDTLNLDIGRDRCFRLSGAKA